MSSRNTEWVYNYWISWCNFAKLFIENQTVMVRRGKLRGLKRQALQRKEAQKKLGIGVQHASYPCKFSHTQKTRYNSLMILNRWPHHILTLQNCDIFSARVNSRSSGYGSLGCMDTLQVNNHLSRSVSVNTGQSASADRNWADITNFIVLLVS